MACTWDLEQGSTHIPILSIYHSQKRTLTWLIEIHGLKSGKDPSNTRMSESILIAHVHGAQLTTFSINFNPINSPVT